MSDKNKLNNQTKKTANGEALQDNEAVNDLSSATPLEKEINGPKGLEPTRYGDWESKGRCYDF